MTAMALPTLPDIEAAAAVVYRGMPATPQYRWALSSRRLGTHCWLKHENHTPVGAFKIRGGLTFFDDLLQRGTMPAAVISATRGNHDQFGPEGAGAAGFAAAMQERDAIRGLVVGTTVSGGNVDSSVFARVLGGAVA